MIKSKFTNYHENVYKAYAELCYYIPMVACFASDITVSNDNCNPGFLAEINCSDFDNFLRFPLRDELNLVHPAYKIIKINFNSCWATDIFLNIKKIKFNHKTIILLIKCVP